MRVARSERERVALDAVAVGALGQDPAELDAIHAHVLAVGTGGVVASGRALELESERFTVGVSPLGNDVGDDAAVVVRVNVEWLSRRSGESVCGGTFDAATSRLGTTVNPIDDGLNPSLRFHSVGSMRLPAWFAGIPRPEDRGAGPSESTDQPA